MIELNDFVNDGFGWKCRHCSRDRKQESRGHSRFFSEGESESNQPELSESAMAKWVDAARTMLTCPRCGITERVDKA